MRVGFYKRNTIIIPRTTSPKNNKMPCTRHSAEAALLVHLICAHRAREPSPVAHRALQGNELEVVLHLWLPPHTHTLLWKSPLQSLWRTQNTVEKQRRAQKHWCFKSLNTMWSTVFLAFTIISLRETFISALLHRKLVPELRTQRNSLAILAIIIRFYIAKPCLRSWKKIKTS